jgi:hypothetical protein
LFVNTELCEKGCMWCKGRVQFIKQRRRRSVTVVVGREESVCSIKNGKEKKSVRSILMMCKESEISRVKDG